MQHLTRNWLAALSLIVLSCAQADRNVREPDIEQPAGTATTGPADSLVRARQALTNLYCKAIADFMQVTSRKGHPAFDTLFIGRRKLGQPDDFPDIELPDRIAGTTIRLIDMADANGSKGAGFRQRSPFINLVGWVDHRAAEFVVVTFYPGLEHRYDVFLNYNYKRSTQQFELAGQRTEEFSRTGGVN